ncbi:hypothetical protein BDZ89DRAFT_609107 [Hymenopellis radicata]|nr:hypothetical protein BDZ89DRAFT_609107 [Hymenopellis radicata]
MTSHEHSDPPPPKLIRTMAQLDFYPDREFWSKVPFFIRTGSVWGNFGGPFLKLHSRAVMKNVIRESSNFRAIQDPSRIRVATRSSQQISCGVRAIPDDCGRLGIG